jgi:hypothetical protein
VERFQSYAYDNVIYKSGRTCSTCQVEKCVWCWSSVHAYKSFAHSLRVAVAPATVCTGWLAPSTVGSAGGASLASTITVAG